MRQVLRALAVLCVVFFIGVSAAQAYHIQGYVYCDSKPLSGVVVAWTWAGTANGSGTVTTDASGFYTIDVTNLALAGLPGTVVLSIQSGLPANATFVSPASGSLNFEVTEPLTTAPDFLLTNCEGKCWMTGGGQKIEPLTGLRLAERGTKHSFGGNVYPGCSPDAGDGGSWNHIAHTDKLHFHAQQIHVLGCGNVRGIPEGSTSPVTPFNFIEFEGTGTLVGIKGNKADFGTVYFHARVEDRNEPGSQGANDGMLIDRYMIRVYTNAADPLGSTQILVAGADGIPIPITHGNLQIHISSCSTPPK